MFIRKTRGLEQKIMKLPSVLSLFVSCMSNGRYNWSSSGLFVHQFDRVSNFIIHDNALSCPQSDGNAEVCTRGDSTYSIIGWAPVETLYLMH